MKISSVVENFKIVLSYLAGELDMSSYSTYRLESNETSVGQTIKSLLRIIRRELQFQFEYNILVKTDGPSYLTPKIPNQFGHMYDNIITTDLKIVFILTRFISYGQYRNKNSISLRKH